MSSPIFQEVVSIPASLYPSREKLIPKLAPLFLMPQFFRNNGNLCQIRKMLLIPNWLINKNRPAMYFTHNLPLIKMR
jgi:hypothetical protein